MAGHYLIRLSPKTPFHFGEMMDMERTEVMLHSDTLFSALCYISDRYLGYDNYFNFISPFIEDKPPFLISSTFPYYKTPDKTLYFFPKPLIFKDFIDKFPKNVKIFKKIHFISERLFNAYLTGNDTYLEEQFQDKNGTIKKVNFIQGNLIWLSGEERKLIPIVENLWKVRREPRIVINRITNETSIYHYSRVHFHRYAGLFFLINIIDETNEEFIINGLLKKLRYLGDTGIGGERSLGNGQFELELNSRNSLNTIQFNGEKNSSDGLIILSLTLPQENDIQNNLMDNNSYYQLINRKGWISDTTYLRKSINLLREGSVLKGNGKEFIGKIIELTPKIMQNRFPEYKIHRYGYSYHLKIKR